MRGLLLVFLLATSVSALPLSVNVTQERDGLMLDFSLVETPPEGFNDALPSGAVVRLTYMIQLRSERRWMWDGRVWKGVLLVSAVFDPITGRYRCESILDNVIVATEEFSDIESASRWLTHPPEVRLAMHDYTRWHKLRIRVRAIYSSSTTWLIFPSTEGTDWVEVRLDEQQGPPSESGESSPTQVPQK